jgi:hypothetical protein
MNETFNELTKSQAQSVKGREALKKFAENPVSSDEFTCCKD